MFVYVEGQEPATLLKMIHIFLLFIQAFWQQRNDQFTCFNHVDTDLNCGSN